jgi:hypothetical protein
MVMSGGIRTLYHGDNGSRHSIQITDPGALGMHLSLSMVRNG